MDAFGLSPRVTGTIRRILADFPEVERAVIYGSRAKGTHKPGSDIDLTLFGDRLTSDIRARIADRLDDSPIPHTVDLSIYAELNHAKLREHIDRVGVVFYERGGDGERSAAAGMKTGWVWKPLGEVCKTGSGGTPLSSRKEYYEGGNIPWLLSGEVAQGNVREAKHFITKAGLENSAAKLFPKDTVLVAMYGATAGQVGILRFEAATNQAVCGILPSDKFVPEFLFYFLLAKKDELVAQATGNAQPNISQVKIKNTEVPVPPLPEQRRIVALLDEAFAGLAVAQANAEKNLQNARALFESHLNEVFSKRGEGWVERRLGECFRLKSGDGLTSKAMNGGRYPVYGGNGIAGTHDEFNLAGDNVIIGRVGALCGNARHISERIWLTDNAFKVVDRSFEFDEAFLVYLLNFKDLRSFARQAAQPVISNSSLQDVALAFPEIREQQRIAAQLDALSAETRRLAAVYERKLAALGALKKSLLHQAFAGGL